MQPLYIQELFINSPTIKNINMMSKLILSLTLFKINKLRKEPGYWKFKYFFLKTCHEIMYIVKD